jgi:hypothetical protein
MNPTGCLIAVVSSTLLSCAMNQLSVRPAKEKFSRITPDNTERPERIRFDLDWTPYAHAQDATLSSNERIRLGMRRYAQEQLELHGYCPYGFHGPDLVLGRRLSEQYYFFVVCLPAPEKSISK